MKNILILTGFILSFFSIQAQDLQALSSIVTVYRLSDAPQNLNGAYTDTIDVQRDFRVQVQILVDVTNSPPVIPDSVFIQHWVNSDSGLTFKQTITLPVVYNNIFNNLWSKGMLARSATLPHLDSGLHRFVFHIEDNPTLLGDTIKWAPAKDLVSWTDYVVGYKGISATADYDGNYVLTKTEPNIPHLFYRCSIIVRPDVLYHYDQPHNGTFNSSPLFLRSSRHDSTNQNSWTPGNFFDDSTYAEASNKVYSFNNGQIILDSSIMSSMPTQSYMDSLNAMSWYADSVGVYAMTFHLKAFTNGQLNLHQVIPHTYEVLWGIGIDESTQGQNILVYPSPFKDQICIEGVPEGSKVEIADPLGRIIYSKEVVIGELTVETQDWPGGIYIIRSFDQSGVVISAIKVTKRR